MKDSIEELNQSVLDRAKNIDGVLSINGSVVQALAHKRFDINQT